MSSLPPKCLPFTKTLGELYLKANNQYRALKHFIISAKAGDNLSLDPIKQAYQQGAVTKGEYANILRTYQRRQDEMKSDQRTNAAMERAIIER